MDRNKFVDLVKWCANKHKISVNWLLDLIEEGYEDDCYKIFYTNENVYIMDLDQVTVINWYKISHVGRCLTLVGFSSVVSTMEEQIRVMIDDMCKICADWRNKEDKK